MFMNVNGSPDIVPANTTPSRTSVKFHPLCMSVLCVHKVHCGMFEDTRSVIQTKSTSDVWVTSFTCAPPKCGCICCILGKGCDQSELSIPSSSTLKINSQYQLSISTLDINSQYHQSLTLNIINHQLSISSIINSQYHQSSTLHNIINS